MTCDKEGNARVLFRIVWWLQNHTQKRPGPFLWIFTSAQRKTDSTFLRARVKQIRSFPRCIPAFRNSPLWENILYLNLHLSYSSRYPFIPLQFMTCAHRPLCETIVPMTTRIKYLCSLQPISPPGSAQMLSLWMICLKDHTLWLTTFRNLNYVFSCLAE